MTKDTVQVLALDCAKTAAEACKTLNIVSNDAAVRVFEDIFVNTLQVEAARAQTNGSGVPQETT